MPKTVEKEPMQKHTLNLYAGDFTRLQELYPEMGASLLVRHLVRAHILKVTPDRDHLKQDIRL